MCGNKTNPLLDNFTQQCETVLKTEVDHLKQLKICREQKLGEEFSKEIIEKRDLNIQNVSDAVSYLMIFAPNSKPLLEYQSITTP